MSEAVPVIDLASGAPAAAVGAACGRWGFFQVVDHGIPAALVDEVWAQARAFFALPMAEKRAVARSRDNPRGYYDRELTKNARDLKEVFDFNLDPHPELASDHPENRLPVDGHNLWPARPPALKATLTDYLKACEALSQRLLGLLCLGLGLPREGLEPHFGPDHTSFARLNYYPLEDPLAPGESAAAAALGDMALHHHSDAGALTVLLQDEVGGLQVAVDGTWQDVEPREGALVINVGDMMQVWSNDRYRSALHRVRPITDRPRLSIPYFFNPSYKTDCVPFEALVGPEGPHYRPINWGRFRQLRADGDYADYGKEVQLDDFRLA